MDKETHVCLNCGCGEPDTRHQRRTSPATDITRDERAAQGGGLTVDEAISSLSDSLAKLETGNATGAAAAQTR